MIIQGYLESENGVRYFLQGGYYCGARLTQLAKSYDERKREYEQLNLPRNYTINNYNFQNANFTNSAMQIATTDSTQNFNFESIDRAIEEFEKEAEKVDLSKEQRDELNDIIADVKEKSKNKSSLIKRALKGLWEFTKEIGAGVLTSYLSFKFGFN